MFTKIFRKTKGAIQSMSGFTYENQGSETMLVYHLGQDEHLDSFAKGMLQENEMEGILRPSFTRRDTEQYLKFPVTSKIPLKDFLQGEMEKRTVLKLCLSVVGAVQEIEEYMLDPDKLLLDSEYVFVDIRKKEAGLVYLPVDEFSVNLPVREYLLGMLSHMQYQISEDVSYVAKLIHFLNQTKRWSFEDLKRHIRGLMEEPETEKGMSPVRQQREEWNMQKSDRDNVSGSLGSYGQEGAGFQQITACQTGRGQETAGGAGNIVPGIPGNTVYPQANFNPIAEDLNMPEKKGLFGGKKKKEPKKPKPEKKHVLPFSGVEVPGGKVVSGAMPKIGIPSMDIPGTAAPEMGIPGMAAPPMDIPGMRMPQTGSQGKGIPDIHMSGDQQPEVILNVDEEGRFLAQQEPVEEKKKGGLFSFGKKKKERVAPEAAAGLDMPSTGVPDPGAKSPVRVPGEAGLQTVLGAGNTGFQPVQRQDNMAFSLSRESGQSDSWAGRGMEQPYQQVGKGTTIYMGHGNSDDENRTVIMGGGKDYGSTMILGSGKSQSGAVSHHVVKLIRRRTGQSMVINKDVFRIGSEAGFVDFYIGDNPAIGSCHADIYEDNGAYYIMDRNSVNHTSVNRIMAQPMQAVQLSNGAIITLADEDFDFIIS